MPDDLKPLQVIPDWKSDSSPSGISYYNRAQDGCPFRRGLDKQYAELLKDMELEDGDPVATSVGSAFHKILEHYYRRTLHEVAFDANNPSVAEALRLFAEYRKYHPVEEFGPVVGAEIEFSLPTDLAQSLLGVSAFTGRIDLVVDILPEKLEELNDFEKRALGISKPGLYAIDHKTMKQKYRDSAMRFLNDFQFWAYPLCWNALYPERPIQGMIANCAVRRKALTRDAFWSVLVPLATPQQVASLKAHLQQSVQLYTLLGTNFKNRSKCLGYGQTCPHWTTGACDRS